MRCLTVSVTNATAQPLVGLQLRIRPAPSEASASVVSSLPELARRRNGTVCFLAGALIALGLTIPFLNLLVPVAAAAMMVHVYKELGRRGRIVTAQDSRPVA